MFVLTIEEISEVSGAGFFRDAGYWLATVIQKTRMPQDEYIWVGG
jgi:hypothetical protein